MDTMTIIWIIVAIVVVLALIALAVAASRKRNQRHRQQADSIRANAQEQTSVVEKREAIAEETAANARRAQAEAEAKAAEAKRLQVDAQTHQNTATTSRDDLKHEWQRADELDPDVKKTDTATNDARATDARTTGAGPTNTRATDARTTGAGPANGRPQRHGLHEYSWSTREADRHVVDIAFEYDTCTGPAPVPTREVGNAYRTARDADRDHLADHRRRCRVAARLLQGHDGQLRQRRNDRGHRDRRPTQLCGREPEDRL